MAAARLRALAEVVQPVAFEHIAVPLSFMAPLDEPSFLKPPRGARRLRIVLDPHNAYAVRER
ncbi:MAG: hypothetical protein R3F62_04775 [Planctomycetota bacterium]